ncbi:glycosyltransferase [Desulfosediminicola flagellatus]|uniref:glycosyltransferase n=1 Tax=Desulfosediminicola flagellatus TaxID=2569541 RepID=UPI0010AC90D2|nr:glycosyltransferase [Desulfosediminicola flagellatus]
MKPRILVFTTTFPRWARDTDPPFVFELCKRLTNEFEVYVLMPHYPGAALHEQLDEIHVKRFRYFIPKYERLAGSIGILPTLKRDKRYYCVLPFFLISALIALIRYSRTLKPALIHAHWLIPLGFFTYLISGLYKIPYIVTAHGGDVFGFKNSIYKKIRSLICKRATTVTAVSIAIKNELLTEHCDTRKIIVLPMGVDDKLFSSEVVDEQGVNAQRFERKKILYVGRLTEVKGVVYLIRAIGEVLEKFPDVCLTIVGSGELDAELQAEVTALGLDGHITFAGAIPNSDLPNYYKKACIFVGPSIEASGGEQEGFGLTFVEAAMSGCLLVGSNVGGIGDIIIDHQTGLLVQQKSSDAISERIIYALSNQAAMIKIARKGRLRCIEKYNWNHIAESYSDIYKRVVEK